MRPNAVAAQPVSVPFYLIFGKYIERRYIYINIIWPDGVDPVTPHWPIRGLPMPLRVFRLNSLERPKDGA